MLSGAGLAEATKDKPITVHMQYDGTIEGTDGTFTMSIPASEFSDGDKIVANGSDVGEEDSEYDGTAEFQYAYAYILGESGAAEYYLSKPVKIEPKQIEKKNAQGVTEKDAKGNAVMTAGTLSADGATVTLTDASSKLTDAAKDKSAVRIDFYVEKQTVQEITVDMEHFGGYYYIEADTLFRDEATGSDLPANFIIPRGKIQSNFTFTLAATGDPSEQMRLAAQ